jgi:hypothetical protein
VNWSTDVPSRQGFRVLVVAVALAHGAALWQLHSSRRPARGSPGSNLVFLGKLLSPPDLSPPVERANATLPAGPGSALVAVAPERALPEPAAAVDSGIKPQDRPPQALSPSTAQEGDAGFLDYLPPIRLSVPPKPLAPREVPFPAEVNEAVDLRVMVSLFIDEAGKVRRIRVDTPAIPAPFAQSIIRTFLATDFTPGTIDAVPVRSLVRIEVAFQGVAASR